MEVRFPVTLHHPGILPLHGCTPFEGQPAILTPVMESSTEVTGFAPDFRISAQKQVSIFKVTSRKEFMLANGLIHQSLRHLNSLLDRVCRLRVRDPWLSRVTDSGALPSQLMQVGTPVYGTGDLRGRWL
jgi:hypothetical protein